MTLYGIDIAKYQAGISLAEVAKEGFSWVEARSSTGFRGQPIDPDFAEFKAEAAHVGLPLVAYHFLYPHSVVPIATQVADCARAIGDTTVPVMIDHETADGTGTPPIADAVAFAVAMRAKGYRVPLWYLPRWVWQGIGSPALPTATGMTLVSSSYVGGKGYASSLYGGAHGPGWAPYGGLTPGIWQFTDKALVAGRYVDADAFEGTAADLQKLLATGAPAPKPKPTPTPAPTPQPAPVPLSLGRNPKMIVVRVDPATVPKGTAWPGWFTWDGQHLAHLVAGEGTTNNGLQVLAACGQTHPAVITFAQYQGWSGK